MVWVAHLHRLVRLRPRLRLLLLSGLVLLVALQLVLVDHVDHTEEQILYIIASFGRYGVVGQLVLLHDGLQFAAVEVSTLDMRVRLEVGLVAADDRHCLVAPVVLEEFDPLGDVGEGVGVWVRDGVLATSNTKIAQMASLR